jgi:hypothetical protein
MTFTSARNLATFNRLALSFLVHRTPTKPTLRLLDIRHTGNLPRQSDSGLLHLFQVLSNPPPVQKPGQDESMSTNPRDHRNSSREHDNILKPTHIGTRVTENTKPDTLARSPNTLLISGLPKGDRIELRERLREIFGAFGEVQYVRVGEFIPRSTQHPIQFILSPLS